MNIQNLYVDSIVQLSQKENLNKGDIIWVKNINQYFICCGEGKFKDITYYNTTQGGKK